MPMTVRLMPRAVHGVKLFICRSPSTLSKPRPVGGVSNGLTIPGGEWLLMVDGAARGNPGEAGCGAVIFDEGGKLLDELYRYLGHATNNVAEYEGLLMGLERVIRLGGKRLRVESDSQLLVRQINGLYRVKDEKLKRLHYRASGLLRQLEAYRIIHVAREYNRLADRLANRAIDSARRS